MSTSKKHKLFIFIGILATVLMIALLAIETEKPMFSNSDCVDDFECPINSEDYSVLV